MTPWQTCTNPALGDLITWRLAPLMISRICPEFVSGILSLYGNVTVEKCFAKETKNVQALDWELSILGKMCSSFVIKCSIV